MSELASWLEERKDRPVGCLGAPVPDVASDAALDSDLRYELNGVRRRKDANSLTLLKAIYRSEKDV